MDTLGLTFAFARFGKHQPRRLRLRCCRATCLPQHLGGSISLGWILFQKMMILCNTDVYFYILCCKYVVLYYSIDCLLGGGGGFNDRGFELGSIFSTKCCFRIKGLILDVRISLCLWLKYGSVSRLGTTKLSQNRLNRTDFSRRSVRNFETQKILWNVIPCSGLLGSPHICTRILTKGGHWYGNLWVWTFHSAENFWREIRAAWQSPKL